MASSTKPFKYIKATCRKNFVTGLAVKRFLQDAFRVSGIPSPGLTPGISSVISLLIMPRSSFEIPLDVYSGIRPGS